MPTLVAGRTAATAARVLAALLPFLVAAYSALMFYHHNIDELLPEVLARPLLAVLFAAAAVFLFMLLVLRHLARASIASAVLLLAALYYRPYEDLLAALTGSVPSGTLPLATYCGAALALLALAIGAGGERRLPVLLLGVFFAVQVGWVGASVASYEVRRALTPDVPAEVYDGLADLRMPEPRRSILYVVFDRYAGADTLASVYGFDNGELISFLRGEGFQVPEASAANYLKTGHSLAATLNLTYLDHLGENRRVAEGDNGPVYRMLRDFRIARLLQGLGYRFALLGSWWDKTEHAPHADYNLQRPTVSAFELYYLDRTLMAALARQFVADAADSREGFCRRNRRQLEALRGLAYVDGPTFAFAHVMLPHDPYLLDAQGNCLGETELAALTKPEKYLGQLQYVNSEIRRFVAAAKRLEPQPIIVIQADEGPYPDRYAGDRNQRDWRLATPVELRQKTLILNALYLPGVAPPPLPQGMTPVNTFRLLLNLYFGAKLELFEDRIVAYRSSRDVYSFFDVTDAVHNGTPIAPEK